MRLWVTSARLIPARRSLSLRRGFAVSSGSPFVTTFPFGLTNTSSTDEYFTTELDVDNPLLLRDTCADFMEAARKDAAERGLGVKDYLTSAKRARSAFFDSGVLHKREEMKCALLNVFKDEGQFALLVGGKNVGKSLLLKVLSRSSITGFGDVPRAVVKIDARTCGRNLTRGLVIGLQDEEREHLRSAKLPLQPQNLRGPERQKLLSALWACLTHLQPTTEFSPTLTEVKGSAEIDFSKLSPALPISNTALIHTLLEIVDDNDMYLCLIIDEANLALPSPPPLRGPPAAPLFGEEEPHELKETQALFALLVALTKESNRINVLLAVSDYGYPNRLRAGGFNMGNITEVIFAGEASPADMRALLQDKWMLGPRLTDVFLAYYGGHVHVASLALVELSNTLDAFDCESVAGLGVSSSIASCMRGSPDDAQAVRMLRSMSVRGFALVDNETDSVTQLICQKDVGGLVDSHATVVGTPPHVRTAGGADNGIVPSSHFLRHMIAKRLYRKAAEDAASATRSR